MYIYFEESYSIMTVLARSSISLWRLSSNKHLPRSFSSTIVADSANSQQPQSQSQSQSRVVVKELEGRKGIFHVQLNRPAKMNSLDMNMFTSICDAAKQLQNNRSVRCVIISGSGKAFCTGLDVASIVKDPMNSPKLLDKPAGTPISNIAQDVGYLWRQLHCPVIASLHGMCFGGGLQIALGCDFRIAAPDCKLSIMEAKWGLIPDMSASVSLRELVRLDVAKELAMTGRIITAAEGERLGLVTHCVAPGADPMERALELATEIVGRSPDSVAYTKRLFQETFRNSSTEEHALHLETTFQKELIGSWNQLSASSKNFGLNLPYIDRKDTYKV